jgi:hypothetical protein
MLQQVKSIFKRNAKKTKPTLKKIKDGKNCYEKEKLPLIELAVNQIYCFFLNKLKIILNNFPDFL